ncbi:mediator of RNA polymerase II transcription subunit 30-like [Mizuhopecten yessoensis]|uniref:Mediator of RNA polymerase II transcription subunit 30 n=1 Tax=Mizuhopecten yessoensis TaxID=6573 RepID=A0A210PQR5_MIZYE|nr:mediator of RNA polymerase II transcription subunit 30-like [Mizuhopecten yessoensis]OWF38849.1 Mediator of RNA polymerase II transcription subunit 30 [Mizuhopecten yessoensis]
MATPGHQYQQMMPGSQGQPGQQPAPYPGVQPGPGPGPGTQQGIIGQPPMQHPPSQMQPQMMSPSATKELNAITLCKKGQEFVQDIVAKVTEIFKQLQTKQMPLPNGVNATSATYMDKRGKLEENLQTLSMGFKKLHLFYSKVNEMSKDCENLPEEALIPIEGQPFEDRMSTSSSEVYYRYVVDENREVIEQLQAKNRELKGIIDQMRMIIWEINTMLVMRKT